ncbi:hypothetical protein VTO73DRAFT_13582 [Trametes versicolor]
MCHRQLRLWKATKCGHLTFSGETNIDCASRDCYNSTAHPATCGAPGSGTQCRCRRYYTQPERIITHEVDTKCPRCP